MRNSAFKKPMALGLCLLFCISSAPGCARLKPEQQALYGYQGAASVKEGKRILPLDWLGNIFGVYGKIILWNWKVSRHNITEETEAALAVYLAENQDILGNVEVQLNRYAPQDAWRRLVKNKGVKWPYRVFIGTFVVLIVDTILINRIFGFDYYNPYTHTVTIVSDLPSIAIHELGHAHDFAERRYRGSYGMLRIIPGVDLYQEFIATRFAFEHAREEKHKELEIESYKVLYPAYGTYVGSYIPYGTIPAVIAGHIWGRIEARPLEKALAQQTA